MQSGVREVMQPPAALDAGETDKQNERSRSATAVKLASAEASRALVLLAYGSSYSSHIDTLC